MRNLNGGKPGRLPQSLDQFIKLIAIIDWFGDIRVFDFYRLHVVKDQDADYLCLDL